MLDLVWCDKIFYIMPIGRDMLKYVISRLCYFLLLMKIYYLWIGVMWKNILYHAYQAWYVKICYITPMQFSFIHGNILHKNWVWFDKIFYIMPIGCDMLKYVISRLCNFLLFMEIYYIKTGCDLIKYFISCLSGVIC